MIKKMKRPTKNDQNTRETQDERKENY